MVMLRRTARGDGNQRYRLYPGVQVVLQDGEIFLRWRAIAR